MRIHADFSSPESRMQFAILLAKKNVEYKTGGPFGAAIFDMDTHQLIAVGINLVVSSQCSHNHAEMVALTLAQQTLQSFSLSGGTLPRCELVSSCEPCAMCFGAIPWSGIKHVSCGATAADAEAIGFDEGPKHPHWIQELETRGITVTTEINRKQAVSVFQKYKANAGTIYNG
ncbi:MAG: nucleoside deaminase [Ghiorsea sp.]